MNNIFIILVLGVILVCVLGVFFILAYDEKISGVMDAIERAGEDD